MIQTHYAASMGWPTALGVGRRAKMRAQSSITSRWCIIGLASCARNVLAAHPPHWRQGGWATIVSITTTRRGMKSVSPKWEPGWRTQGRFQHPSGCLIGDNPHPTGTALEENQIEEVWPANPTCPITSVFLHTQIRWPLPSANPELNKKSTRDAELYELKFKS